MAIKILKLYGNLVGNVAHIIHAKIAFDDGPPFCNPATGQGVLTLPRQDNDGECIPAAQAKYMWPVPPSEIPMAIDLDSLSK